MSDEKMERLLRETARLPDEDPHFAARTRAAYEARAPRRWLTFRDFGFALAGAAAALALATARPAPTTEANGEVAAADEVEEIPTTHVGALEALDDLDSEDLDALESLIDERLEGDQT